MSAYSSIIALSALDGVNGFRIDGTVANGHAGSTVAVMGDVNGDGIDDLIIGEFAVDPQIGNGYVLFGSASGFGATVSLSSLDGSNGFRLDGTNVGSGALTGATVSSAGDFNHDGISDLAISAYQASPGGISNSGETFVVFGTSSGFSASLDLTALDGSNGFAIDGAKAFDYSGVSVASAGDVNGDGISDLVIGAVGANSYAGAAYVVFGKADGFPSHFELASIDGGDGSMGFRIDGTSAFDASGLSVSSAGDVNGDGFADLLIGAVFASPGGNLAAGSVYVVFGASSFSTSLALSSLDGSNGFRMDGLSPVACTGTSVATGDINGDGLSDLFLGANGADGGAGSVYVIFGHHGGFDSIVDLNALNGSNGFRIDGVSNSDGSGFSVARAGDVNGDGFDDLIIGATGANGGTGAAYVVFGKASGFSGVLDLSTLDGSNGYAIDGIASGDNTGYSVSGGGDLNHDGLDDIVIGAYGANGEQGSSFVVYGSLPGEAVTRVGSDIGQTIHGGNFNDTLSGLGGDDVLDGHGGIDKMIGGTGNDTYYVDSNSDKVIETGDGETDTVYASVSFTLKAGVKVENLVANAGATGLTLKGNEFANHVTGGIGADKLDGGNGNDMLTGGAGKDVLSGGAGADTFVFGAAVAADADKVNDFKKGIDKVAVYGSDYGLASGALDPTNFVDGTGPNAHHAQFIFDDANHTLNWDADGIGGAAPVLVATFTAGVALHATDFLIL